MGCESSQGWYGVSSSMMGPLTVTPRGPTHYWGDARGGERGLERIACIGAESKVTR